MKHHVKHTTMHQNSQKQEDAAEINKTIIMPTRNVQDYLKTAVYLGHVFFFQLNLGGLSSQHRSKFKLFPG